MCLDSEKRINTASDEHSEDGNDNHLDSRWANRNRHIGSGHAGNGHAGNGHAAPEIAKNPIELFASPDHSVPSADTDQAQNAPQSERSSRIPTSNGSSGWNFWSMVKSPSALLATYVREKDQRHTAGAHDKGIEMVKIWEQDTIVDDTGSQLVGKQTRKKRVVAYFFLSAVGYTITWTAIQSLLAMYKMKFGSGFFLQLNACYYAPSLPMLFIQSKYDGMYDQKYGRRYCHIFRNSVALGSVLILTMIFPFTQSANSIRIMAVLLGVLCSISFGSTYQLVPAFSPTCTVSLTLGYVGSGPLILLLTFLVGFGNKLSTDGLLVLFESVAVVVAIGFAATILIVNRPEIRHLNAGGRIKGLVEPLLEAEEEDFDSFNTDKDDMLKINEAKPFDVEQTSDSTFNFWSHVIPCAIPLSVNMLSTILVYPFFTFVTSSRGDECLSQKLFYCRMCSDAVGRLINLSPRVANFISSTKVLSCLVLLRSVSFVPLFFMYISDVWPFARSDVLIAIAVSLFWLMGGLLNTSAYKMAPTLVPPEYQARAGSVMTFTFQTSIATALILGFIIRYTFF